MEGNKPLMGRMSCKGKLKYITNNRNLIKNKKQLYTYSTFCKFYSHMPLLTILSKIFRFILGKLPLKRDYIIFESIPELDGSPWMIYQELVKKGFDQKYKLVWFTEAKYKDSRSITCIPYFKQYNWIKIAQNYYILAKAKVIVENNRFLNKINSKTFRLHTQHGAPLKKCFFYTFEMGNVDAVLSLSKNMAVLEKKIFPSAQGKIFPLGYPTNDRLFNAIDLYKNGFWKECTKTEKIFKKIIGWLPTYRQYGHSNLAKTDIIFPYGIPLLYTKQNMDTINDILKKNDILLVVQIHHVQAKNFPNFDYSNIVLISSSIKEKHHISTINLMHNFDALITDYSAAYHEYILLNRPIALSIDDFEQYSENPGFSINYFDWIKGVYLKNYIDLINFINDVAKGIDSAKEERLLALHRIHKYLDNHSTQRVVNFLIEKAKL